MLEGLRCRASFSINVIVFETNRGSTEAVTTAIRPGGGDFTMILDHDDELMPGALASLLNVWDEISETEDATSLSGIFGRCVNERDQLIGRRLPPLIIGTLGYSWMCKNVRGSVRAFSAPSS